MERNESTRGAVGLLVITAVMVLVGWGPTALFLAGLVLPVEVSRWTLAHALLGRAGAQACLNGTAYTYDPRSDWTLSNVVLERPEQAVVGHVAREEMRWQPQASPLTATVKVRPERVEVNLRGNERGTYSGPGKLDRGRR